MAARYSSYASQRGANAAESPGVTPTRKPRRQWQLDTTETDVSAKKLLAARPDSPELDTTDTTDKDAGEDLSCIPAVGASVDNWLPSGKLAQSDDSDTLLSAKRERGRKPVSEVRSSMPALSSTRVRRQCLACKRASASTALSRACPRPSPGTPSSRCTCSRMAAAPTTAPTKGTTARPPQAPAPKASRLKPAPASTTPPAAPDLEAVIAHLLTSGQATTASSPATPAKPQQQPEVAAGGGSQHAAELAGALAQLQGTQSAAAEAAVSALRAYLAVGRMQEALEQLRSLQHKAARPSSNPNDRPSQIAHDFIALHPTLLACALALPPGPQAPLAPSTLNPPARRPIPLLTQLTAPPSSTPSSSPGSPKAPSSAAYGSPCSSLDSASSASDSQTPFRSHPLASSYSTPSQSATTTPSSSSATTPFLTPDPNPPPTSPSTLTPEPSLSPRLFHASSTPLPPAPQHGHRAASILESAESWFLEVVDDALCEGAWVRTRDDCVAVLKAVMSVQDWLEAKLAGRRGPIACEAVWLRLRAAKERVGDALLRWNKERLLP